MSQSTLTSDGKTILSNYRKHYANCPPSKDVGRMFRLNTDTNYYLKTFPTGTEIEFLGVVVSRIKSFPTVAAFRFPDGTVRFATIENIKPIQHE